MFLYYRCVEKKKIEYLLDMAEDNDGYVKSEDAKKLGIANSYLSYLVEEGLFLRMSRGLYLRKGSESDHYYELHVRYKKAVFAFKSALYLNGLIDNEPPIEIALPTNYMTKGIEGIKFRHLGSKEYSTGLSLIVTPKGNLVSSYDLERCLIEVLRNPADFKKEEIHSIWAKANKKGVDILTMRNYAEAFNCLSSLELALAIL